MTNLSESMSAGALLTPSASVLPNTPIQRAKMNNDSILDSGGRVQWSLADEPVELSTPHDSLHAIHNFEININLDLGGAATRNSLAGNGQDTPSKPKDLDSSVRTTAGLSDSINSSSTPVMPNGSSAKPNRRMLNLQEYKKRLGLI